MTALTGETANPDIPILKEANAEYAKVQQRLWEVLRHPLSDVGAVVNFCNQAITLIERPVIAMAISRRLPASGFRLLL